MTLPGEGAEEGDEVPTVALAQRDAGDERILVAVGATVAGERAVGDQPAGGVVVDDLADVFIDPSCM